MIFGLIRKRRRDKRAERLGREVATLRHEVERLKRDVDVRDLEIRSLYEVVERNRARVLAETAAYVKRQASNTVGEIDA